MISKWHVQVYWYSILTMILFMIILILPDSKIISKTPPDNYNKQMSKLADANLKANTAAERGKIARQYTNLHKQKSKKSEEVTFNFIPFKFLLLIAMGTFTYLIIKNFWARRDKAFKAH